MNNNDTKFVNCVELSVEAANEIARYLALVDSESIETLVKKILKAPKIYVAGLGRSGLMLRAFAMRLMHLGLNVFVVGEIVTPAVEAGDLVIMGSGSGKTSSLVLMAKKVKEIGAELAILSVYPESDIGQYADYKIKLHGKSGKVSSDMKSVQPGGNLFEQSMLILLDAMIVGIAELGNIDISKFKRHANLE